MGLIYQGIRDSITQLLIGILRFYRYCISPYLGNHCRFHPSCSAYAQQALTQHGLIKALMLSVCRILRCHPFHPGGYDPVPEHKPKPKLN